MRTSSEMVEVASQNAANVITQAVVEVYKQLRFGGWDDQQIRIITDEALKMNLSQP